MSKQTINYNILIIAGEASGDLHAARLIKAALKLNPNLHFTGIGCQHMRNAGVKLLMNATEIAVVGFIEVFTKIKQLWQARQLIKNQLTYHTPDMIILVDYPGFNLRIAKLAKQANVKVIYYISPQVWAWHKGRIKDIKKYVDHMMVVLPFETALYDEAHIPVTFVGHPLTTEIDCELPQEKARQHLKFSPNTSLICLMPGSRDHEIKRLLPVMLKTAVQLQKQQPNIQFVLARAPTILQEMLDTYLANYTALSVKITTQTYTAIRAADLVITASGTATLEISLLGTPMIILYKLSPLTFWIIKCVVHHHLQNFSLCNIIAGKRICPEFIQKEVNPKRIIEEVLPLLNDKTLRTRMQRELATVKSQLGTQNASLEAAKIILKYLK